MNMIKGWLGLVVLAALALASTASAQRDTIASVKQKCKIVVGVKADYKPFGYTDPSGKIVGLEIDLANDVAKRLGVQIELVPVIAANRMEFLKQGRIDLMIATMAYKPDRAEVIGIPQPFYYAGAANVFAKNFAMKTHFKKDLKSFVCATKNAAPIKSWVSKVRRAQVAQLSLFRRRFTAEFKSKRSALQ